ncbi:MAG: hypothetical protein K6G58_02465, partial [Lachnospiraceae bacterium]|nr:hypothetical protein [Lachnospiraceae bacterium]
RDQRRGRKKERIMNSMLNGIRPKRKVLVVEDEMINREILGNMLSGEYEVVYAENGQRALDILK